MSEYQFNIDSEAIDEKALAWKESRCGKFTSSSIAKLLVKSKDGGFGVGAMTYIYKKIAEAITMEYNEVSSAAIKWGNEHEKDAYLTYMKIKEYEGEYYGKENPLFIAHGNHAGGSPDGLVITTGSTLELKCPFESGNHLELYHQVFLKTFDLKKWDSDYYGQCQFNMFLQKKDNAKFVSYDPRVVDYKFCIAEATIKRDDEYIKELLECIDKAVEVKIKYLTELGYYESEEQLVAA